MFLFRDQIKRLRAVQLLFFAALVVVVTLTVLPAPDVPVTFSLNDKLLHFIAYFGLGLLGGTGWPERRAMLLISMPLFGMALECVQGGLVPGRAFDWLDGVANAIGAVVGVASSYIARRILFASP